MICPICQVKVENDKCPRCGRAICINELCHVKAKCAEYRDKCDKFVGLKP